MLQLKSKLGCTFIKCSKQTFPNAILVLQRVKCVHTCRHMPLSQLNFKSGFSLITSEKGGQNRVGHGQGWPFPSTNTQSSCQTLSHYWKKTVGVFFHLLKSVAQAEAPTNTLKSIFLYVHLKNKQLPEQIILTGNGTTRERIGSR